MSALGRLTRAVRASIHANGGIDGAAATTSKARSTTGAWNNLNEPDLPTLGDALALDEIALAGTGRAPILHSFAAELGHVAIQLPQAHGEGEAVVLALADATGEFGDVAHAITDALRDGKISGHDPQAIISEIDDAQAKLAQLRALVINHEPREAEVISVNRGRA